MKLFLYIKDIIRRNRSTIILFIAIAVFYSVVGCPSRVLFGISCPGCGMTRAVRAALQLDFSLAFESHPLVFLLPVAAVVYFIRKKIPKKLLIFMGVSALVLMLAVFVYRLCTGSDIVYFDFEKGLIYKILNN
ncbi:MAG: DUF2752 domain-containing protein [Clostridia bacterium]|nr:DUF2752 domain-containing protein [Clostridia bacterium]